MTEASAPEHYRTLWKGTVTVSVVDISKFLRNFCRNTYNTSSVTCRFKPDYSRNNLDWSCEVSYSREGTRTVCSIALVLNGIWDEDVIYDGIDSGKLRRVMGTARRGTDVRLLFKNLFYVDPNYASTKSTNFNVTVLSKARPDPRALLSQEGAGIPEFFRVQSDPADEYISKMLDNQEFSDVTIQTEGTEFFTHKLILGQSPVFAKMLQTPMQEGLSSVIEIKDVDQSVVELMLEFLYKLDPDIPEDKERLLQLLDLAERYDLPGLKNSCFEKMALTLSPENAADFNVAAWRYSGDERVREHFKKYCRGEMKAIGQTEGSKQLIQDNWEAFF